MGYHEGSKNQRRRWSCQTSIDGGYLLQRYGLGDIFLPLQVGFHSLRHLYGFSLSASYKEGKYLVSKISRR